MDYQYDKLLLRQTRGKSQAELYLADDELVLESGLGRLFIIVEIFSHEKKVKQLIQKITANLEADFYNSPTPDSESSLETACQNLNLNLPDLVLEPDKWMKKLNILAGVVKDSQIFLTASGRFKTLLIRGNKLINIIPDKELKKETGEEKIFSNLITGEIEAKDIFLFSNLSLFDYFSLTKIKKTVETLNPEQAVEYFKSILLENTNPISFASIIFKFDKELKFEISQEAQNLREFYSTQESMANLANMERKTTKVLAASILPNVKKIFSRCKKLKLDKDKKQLIMPEKQKSAAVLRITKPKLSLAPIGLKIKNGSRLIASLPKTTFNKTKNLNIKAKRIAALALVLVIIFIGSLFLINNSQKIKRSNQEFSAQAKQIEDQISSAQAALIYQDEEAAAENLKQAKILLASLPETKPDWQKKYDELDEKIKVTLNKIYNIYEIEAQTITDLEKIGIIKILSLIKNKNQIFALSENQNLYEINPQEKSFTLLGDNFNFISAKNWNDDNLIFLDDTKKFTTYNLKEDLKSAKPIELSKTIDDWAVYGDKIYVLDSNVKQIFKISQPFSVSPQIANWHKGDGLILEKAKSLVIDGDIWVASSQGKIFQFYKGVNQEFEIKKLNKEFGLEIELYTETDWSRIYVLDRQNSRLLTLRKSGIVEKQLINESFKNAANLTINNQETKAWFNNGGKILEVDLTME